MGIDFTEYDRITDILFYFNQFITLNFNVTFSRKSKDGSRMYYQFETEYSSRFVGTNKARAIKRNMNFYFTIDNKNDFGGSFILRPSDVFILLNCIKEQIMPWFFGNKRIFTIKENRLIIKGDFNPVMYAQSEYKYISFSPIVLSFEDGTYKEGVRFTLNNKTEFVDMSIDNFMGLYYILQNTDMYSAACSLCTYVKQSPYGVNIFRQNGLGGGYEPDTKWSESNTKTNSNKSGSEFLNNIKRTEG